MYLLPALAAGLVRCIYIDRLHKLSEGIGGQLREGAVPLYPLNKLLYILCLLFLFIRIYEDNVAGRLDDERFAMMSKNYTEEQKDLKAEVKNLQQQIHEQEQQAENIEQFVHRVKRNSTLTELTPYALRELVKAVYVDAPDKSSGKRRQKVHIEYDLVGYIPVDELLKAEQA